MEGGELFQRIQEKQAFNERGKHCYLRVIHEWRHTYFSIPLVMVLIVRIVNSRQKIGHILPLNWWRQYGPGVDPTELSFFQFLIFAVKLESL